MAGLDFKTLPAAASLLLSSLGHPSLILLQCQALVVLPHERLDDRDCRLLRPLCVLLWSAAVGLALCQLLVKLNFSVAATEQMGTWTH